MTLRDYLRVFRRRWLIILACVLLAAGVTWFVTSDEDTTRRPTGYTATATLLVGTRPAPSPARGQEPVRVEPVNLSRVSLFIKSGEISKKAAQALGHQGDPALLAEGLTVQPDSAAGAIKITAASDDADRAAAVANTFADQTVAFYADGRDNAQVSILQRATPIAQDKSAGVVVPAGKLPRSLIAASIGLLLGLALALIVDHLDSRLRTREQVSKTLRMPVIAEAPRLRASHRRSLHVVEEPMGPYADAYRSARTAITHLEAPGVEGVDATTAPVDAPGTAKVVLVTSGLPGEGKSTSAANLAASFAETGKSVLVVDADLRKPDTHELLGVPLGAGVTNLLLDPDSTQLPNVIRPTSVPGVRMITAGTRLESPTAMVSRMGPLLDALRSAADIVIVDTSPLLAASDVYDLLPLVDSVLIVVRSGRLTDVAGERMAEVLGRFQTPVIGAMLIGAPASSRGYGYGYGYAYGTDKKRRLNGSKRPAGKNLGRRIAAGATPSERIEATELPSHDRRP